MQEPKNAPWGKENDLSRTQYVTKIKAIDTGTQYEPPVVIKEKQSVATSPRREMIPAKSEKRVLQQHQSTEDFVFHDFDYVGYEENDLNRSFNPEMHSIGVGREQSGVF